MERLFVICRACGGTESLDPAEWRAGGDAHHFARAHYSCGTRTFVARVIPFKRINGFYRCRDTAARETFLKTHGRWPGGAA
jgi:hypothetical protein